MPPLSSGKDNNGVKLYTKAILSSTSFADNIDRNNWLIWNWYYFNNIYLIKDMKVALTLILIDNTGFFQKKVWYFTSIRLPPTAELYLKIFTLPREEMAPLRFVEISIHEHFLTIYKLLYVTTCVYSAAYYKYGYICYHLARISNSHEQRWANFKKVWVDQFAKLSKKFGVDRFCSNRTRILPGWFCLSNRLGVAVAIDWNI